MHCTEPMGFPLCLELYEILSGFPVLFALKFETISCAQVNEAWLICDVWSVPSTSMLINERSSFGTEFFWQSTENDPLKVFSAQKFLGEWELPLYSNVRQMHLGIKHHSNINIRKLWIRQCGTHFLSELKEYNDLYYVIKYTIAVPSGPPFEFNTETSLVSYCIWCTMFHNIL